MANRSSGENLPDSSHAPRGSGKVMTITQLAKKYNLAPPDEIALPFGGSEENNFSYLDYGPPTILTDSSRVNQRTIYEDRLWAKALGEPKKPAEAPSLGSRAIEHVKNMLLPLRE